MECGYTGQEYSEMKNSIKNGWDFWERLLAEHPVVDWRYYVFLFSEDAEVNYYTVHYLPAVEREKNISEFIIIAASPEVVDMVRREAKVPFLLYEVSQQERKDISRFFVYFKEERSYKQMRINGTPFQEDIDFLRLLRQHSITPQNIAARVALLLDREPSEELLNTPKLEETVKCHCTAIDWKREESLRTLPDVDMRNYEAFVEAGLQAILTNGQISPQDKIVLCTKTNTTAVLIDLLQGYQVIAVIDNNEEQDGSIFHGIPVYQTEEFLKNETDRGYKFIVPTRSYRAICEQLNYYGYELHKQVYITYGSNPYSLDAERTILWEKVYAGKSLYDLLRLKYPSHQIYICPYPGTGDAFLVGMYLSTMRAEHGESGEYVLVTTSGSCKKILSLFGIEAVVMNRAEAFRILQFAKVMGFENVKVLNDGYRPMKYENLRGCNGIDFHSLFRISVFDVKEPLPIPEVPQENADHLFLEYRLIKGKTILLSPYANTILPESEGYWEQIAEVLKEKGYTVCTNSASKEEVPIKGTEGIMIPYHQILDFLHKAGGFIGMRSGLCDIVAGAKAKKLVVYPKGKPFDKTTVFEYFSLKKMFPDIDNLVEIEIEEDEQEKLLTAVNEYF